MRVIQGSVLDVVVDIRAIHNLWAHLKVIYGENKTMFWTPPGFAHGFITLEDNTIFTYKCTVGYNKESERTIVE